MPETNHRVGAAATTAVSTRTRSGCPSWTIPPLERPRRVVQHRQPAGRRVGRRDRRDRHESVGGRRPDGLGRVECLAPTGTHDDVCVDSTGPVGEALYLLGGALAAERCETVLTPRGREGLLDRLTDDPPDHLVRDEQDPVTDSLDLLTEL
jgi:hypothetical protein